MNPNQIAVDVLAREGIPITEGEWLLETRKTQPSRDGATTAPAASNDLGYLERVSWNVPERKGVADDAGAVPAAAGEAELVTRRGRQRAPKPWLMAVLCRLGVHGAAGIGGRG